MINAIRDLFSPVLSDRQIRRYIERGQLIPGGITEPQGQPNSVDLTLSDSVSYLQPNCTLPWPENDIRDLSFGNSRHIREGIDPKLPVIYAEDHFDHGEYVLEPGEFVLMATRERLSIPNGILGFVCGRSSIARLAIQTEQAGLIDSGFNGTVTLEVMNQSRYPIVLREGMRVAQVWFIRSKRSGRIYDASRHSKYNGQRLATGSKLYLDVENLKCD